MPSCILMILLWYLIVTHDLEQLSKRLGCKFSNNEILEKALSHRSVRGINNERLEFLGDSIVNFIIAEALFSKFPDEREGQLSRLRSTLVRGDTLAELAKEFELGEFIRLGPGEMRSGGQLRPSILADTFEAVIAAVYIDAGMEVCREKVLDWYSERLDKVSVDECHKDPKTQLQEYVQARGLPLPNYDLVQTTGAQHQQTFHIKCTVDGLDYEAQGTGTSRRRAEQVAAEDFVAHGT